MPSVSTAPRDQSVKTDETPVRGSTLSEGLRVIGRGFRGQPRTLLVAVIGSAIYGVMTVATARVIGHLVDTVVQPAVTAGRITGEQTWTIIWQLGIVVLLNVIGVILRRVAAGIAYFNLNAMYRQQVTRQYLRLPLSWHHRHPSGQLLSNANADVEATWNIFQPLPMAIGVIVMLCVGLAEMFSVDLWLALVGMIVFPLLFVTNLVFQRHMSPRVTRAQRMRSHVSEVAHESIEAGLLVKVMGREQQEADRFAGETQRLRDAAVEVGRVRGIFDPLVEAIPTIGTLAVLAVGTAQVSAGHTTPAEVVQIAYLFSVLAFPVRSFGWVLAEMPRSVAGWVRLNSVLGASGHMTYGERRLQHDGPAAIAADAVGYEYDLSGTVDLSEADQSSGTDRWRALEQVALDLQPGSLTAIVGPTGSGKSTLMSLLVRLMDATEGTVRLDGVPAPQLAQGQTSAAAALVTQQTFVFDDTVEGNVTLGAPFTSQQVQQALQIAQAHDFVDGLSDGLHTRVGERGASLSGGQRQRVALARAVIRAPRALLLDDATSAVDPAVEQSILQALRDNRDGTTVVMVAYRMSSIALADQVVFMDEGRVVDRGRHDELMVRCAGYRNLVTAYADRAAEVADAQKQEQA
ncbi:ABC transporter ATP-binding protein [Yimella sp. cx-573]|nr:ABC transporter ATP-binding protein [Yimella sp. cx-573]